MERNFTEATNFGNSPKLDNKLNVHQTADMDNNVYSHQAHAESLDSE